MKNNHGGSTPVEKIFLEEACLRFAVYAEKLGNVNCLENHARLEKDFIDCFAELCRKQGDDTYTDDLIFGRPSALSGYDPDGSIEKHLSLVLTALDMTYQKDVPAVQVVEKAFFSRGSKNPVTRDVTQKVTEFLDNNDPFIQMLGNVSAVNLVETMTAFSQELPDLAKEEKHSARIFTMNRDHIEKRGNAVHAFVERFRHFKI